MVGVRPVLARLGLLVAVGLLCVIGGTPAAEAQSAVQMGLDMNTAGNTASTLGIVQVCQQVAWSGTPFDGVADRTIDVFVRGDTQAPIVYDAWITYDNNKVHVLTGTPTAPLIKMPGASNLSGYEAGQASFAAMYSGLPPYDNIAGDGTLVRVGLDIGGSGLLTFDFANGAYRSEAGLHSVATVPGQLAVNSTCPAVGGIAELPDLAASADSSPDYVIVAGATAAGAIGLALAATYARRRRRSRAVRR